MIAIPISKQLFELQEIDTALAQLQRERDALDDGSAARSKLELLGEQLREQEQRLEELSAIQSSHEKDLATRENRLQKQQTRLMSAKTTHEAQSLERDIAALQEARGELDEKILLAMDEVEQATEKLEELRAQLKEQQESLAQIEQHFAAETERIGGEEGQLQTQRAAIFETLSAAEQKKYSDAIDKYKGIAVAHNNKGTCSACGTTLTPFILKSAKMDDWPTCESCRRFLYIK